MLEKLQRTRVKWNTEILTSNGNSISKDADDMKNTNKEQYENTNT